MKKDRRTLAGAYATTSLGVSSVSLLAPVLPELAARYGVEAESMAVFQMAVMLPGIVTALLMGRLGARGHLRGALAVSLLVFGVAGASLALVESFPAAVLLRVVQGAGGGGLVAASFMLIGTVAEPRRLRAVGHNAAIVSTMMVLQPLLGAGLGALSAAAPFGFYGLAIVAAVLVPRTVPAAARVASPVRVGRSGPPREVRAALVMTVVLNVLVFGWLLLLTPLILDDAGVDLGWRGWALAAQSAIATVATFATARWRNRRRFDALLVGGWAAAASLLAVAAAGPAALTAVVLVLAGVFYGVLNPTLVARISPVDGGRWLGWWQSAARLGQVLGPLLAGALYGALTPGPVLLVGAAAAGTALLAVRRPRPPEGGVALEHRTL
ncbi:MFS transporter [Georgenia sp. MJ206]|uniref:MFS transporter n=1 Tax=Georgenia wangjunii TaxID=3117730 RepID=UPI002F26633F